MRTSYPVLLLVLLILVGLIGACSAPGAPAAPVIPGLAGTLAAETLTALEVFSTPEPTMAPLDAPTGAETLFENPPTPTPPAPPTQTVAERAAAANEAERCTNLAEFVRDVTVPDDHRVDPNEPFVKTWEFRNAGTCTWTPEYSIVFMWGEPMSCPARVPINATVPPGETLTISVPLVAPETPMDYQGNWMFQDGLGARFGTGYKARQFFWVSISVNGQGFGPNGQSEGCRSGG